jgi:hypothetical protein
MKLYLDDENAFKDIQSEFTALYPFLKIDFFKSFTGAGKQLAKIERIHPEENIRRFVRKIHGGIVNIGEYRTVGQVVRDIEEMLGLTVMILRQSGNIWIETSLTAYWTLEQQNREGEYISRIR